MSTVEKEYSINFTEQQDHYNGINSYIFANGIEIYKYKASNFEINAAPLCLGNVLKYFSVDNMKKTGLYDNTYMIFQVIMIVITLMIFWIFINI